MRSLFKHRINWVFHFKLSYECWFFFIFLKFLKALVLCKLNGFVHTMSYYTEVIFYATNLWVVPIFCQAQELLHIFRTTCLFFHLHTTQEKQTNGNRRFYRAGQHCNNPEGNKFMMEATLWRRNRNFMQVEVITAYFAYSTVPILVEVVLG